MFFVSTSYLKTTASWSFHQGQSMIWNGCITYDGEMEFCRHRRCKRCSLTRTKRPPTTAAAHSCSMRRPPHSHSLAPVTTSFRATVRANRHGNMRRRAQTRPRSCHWSRQTPRHLRRRRRHRPFLPASACGAAISASTKLAKAAKLGVATPPPTTFPSPPDDPIRPQRPTHPSSCCLARRRLIRKLINVIASRPFG